MNGRGLHRGCGISIMQYYDERIEMPYTPFIHYIEGLRKQKRCPASRAMALALRAFVNLQEVSVRICVASQWPSRIVGPLSAD